ncbi:hypothetical protein [Cellulosimicrobium cellulans]|uniref:hypothetical protein n=1 Tax=Cellulosimicrobium cellulans TaxID=1710 RepID=UPI00130EA257|nr:hypothetical protein [Cellulosimicrobium cellulans]
MTSELAARSEAFACEVGELIRGALGVDVQVVSVRLGDRYAIRPAGDTAPQQRIPLCVNGQHLADLSLALYQTLDHSRKHLKTTRTDFGVFSTLDRTPLLRLEYRSDMREDPVCHWQVHAERGAFSHLLSIANSADARRVPSPHDLSKVHLPVGGERFRPCLEDLIEMLIRDCGIDAAPGWQQVLEAERERWRLRQFRTAVRDLQDEAAAVLRAHGWEVTSPDHEYSPHVQPYRTW